MDSINPRDMINIIKTYKQWIENHINSTPQNSIDQIRLVIQMDEDIKKLESELKTSKRGKGTAFGSHKNKRKRRSASANVR